jgi:thioredoxin-like negative regulator of GroEL
MPLPIITEITDVKHFGSLIENNPGLFIIKFGADWCGPCKLIDKDVETFFNRAPENVQCALIDVDTSFEIYSFLKTKKMVNGIPAILCYYKGNLNYIPDDTVIGANKAELYAFFERCVQKSIAI